MPTTKSLDGSVGCFPLLPFLQVQESIIRLKSMILKSKNSGYNSPTLCNVHEFSAEKQPPIEADPAMTAEHFDLAGKKESSENSRVHDIGRVFASPEALCHMGLGGGRGGSGRQADARVSRRYFHELLGNLPAPSPAPNAFSFAHRCPYKLEKERDSILQPEATCDGRSSRRKTKLHLRNL